jgi:nucleoid-associated protein YgaU
MPDRKPGIESGGHTSIGREDLKKVEPHDSGIVSGASSQLTSEDEHAAQSYTVVKGDSLSKIAKRVYGKASMWKLIFEANRDKIENADLIYPGQVLRIPKQ